MRIVPEGFGCKTPRAFVVSAGASRSAVATAQGNVVTSPVWESWHYLKPLIPSKLLPPPAGTTRGGAACCGGH
jgi:hypothetical protein